MFVLRACLRQGSPWALLRHPAPLNQHHLQQATCNKPSDAPTHTRAAASAVTPDDGSMAPVGGYTPITKQLWLERVAHAAQDSPASSPTGQAKSVLLAFATDRALREVYKNPWDRIRMGSVMEDLDSLAGSIAFQHCFNTPGKPPLLVTASVDEITLTHPISVHQDITLQGSVAWTGSSSLDIVMTVNQPQHDQPSLTALFSFVNIDPRTRKPCAVPPVHPHSPEQQALFQARQHVADERKKARQAAAAAAAAGAGHVVVSPEARAFITPLLAASRRLRELPSLVSDEGRGAVRVADTQLQNTFVCQPQQRNMHGRIFGGFLMRRAYELAFATTYTFAGSRPVFLKCEEITFKKPVDVGDLLRFRSQVLHTEQLHHGKGVVCVEVEATVSKPEKCQVEVTNTFNFVFEVEAHPTRAAIKTVLPGSEEEALRAFESYQALKLHPARH